MRNKRSDLKEAPECIIFLYIITGTTGIRSGMISCVMDINEKLTVTRVHLCIAIMENDVHHARLIKNPTGSKEK